MTVFLLFIFATSRRIATLEQMLIHVAIQSAKLAFMRTTLDHFLQTALPGYSVPTMVAGDASFRRYFRTHHAGISYIIMDAPPSHEDAGLFAQIATAFAQAGVNVPQIIETDLDNGYLLMSDFGDEQLQPFITTNPQHWLPIALDRLFALQTHGGQHVLPLPDYDHTLLLRELSLFPEWFITELLGQRLNAAEESALNDLNRVLIDNALNQPQVWVHRDYHSRNLMKVGADDLGVLDFQDAVFGAVTYDLVSLLKDCYVRYPKSLLHECLQQYYLRLVASERYHQDFDVFVRAFDYMGLQRHLKVLGIFARLSIRDGKHGYLNDLPLVFDYVLEVVNAYDELHPYLPMLQRLGSVFEEKVLQ